MSRLRNNFRKSVALALGLALACGLPASADDGDRTPICQLASEPESRPELALMGTIPIYWGDVGELDELLSGGSAQHWARAELERNYRLVPLDYLSAEALAGHRFLMLAQPRGFAPEENVALDAWVRGGGQLLLFADPWMTGESRFPIGDRRRPQAVALLSPILAHWGLELQYEPQQPDRLEMREIAGIELPTRLSGGFLPIADAAECALFGDGLMAQCRLGGGAALLVADAAMLDHHDPAPQSSAALAGLLARAFGENAGRDVAPISGP